MKKWNVLIIGAGIIGMSSAFHIKNQHRDKSVLVLDRYPGVCYGNTAKAAGMVRNLFSSSTNRLLAETSINYYRFIQKNIHDIEFKPMNYLLLYSKEQWSSQQGLILGKENIEIIEKEDLKKEFGIETNPSDEESRIMNLPEVEKGIKVLNCGEINQNELVNFYEQKFWKLGGEISLETEVESLILSSPYVWEDPQVVGVQTSDQKIEADKVILATGAYTPQLLDPIGIDCISKPKKRQMFQIGSFRSELSNLPFTVLPKAQVFIKPDLTSESLWLGCSDDIGRSFDYDIRPEKDLYEYNIRPIASKYIPPIGKGRILNSQAGLYSVNSLDGVPVVFERGGLVVATGCSGSGIMKGDAIGRIVEGVYSGKEFVGLWDDVSFPVKSLSIKTRKVEKEELII